MPITPRFSLSDINALNYRDLQKHISPGDVRTAQITGFSAADIEGLRLFTYEWQLLLVIRCPKTNTRQFIGKIRPKPMILPADASGRKPRSDEDGLGPDGKWASDYDIMGVFEALRGDHARTYTRVMTCKPTITKDERPPITPDGAALLRHLNNRVVEHRFQHCANDDWKTPDGKPHCDVANDLMAGKHYVVFTPTAFVRYLPSFGHLRKFYEDNGLDWPYG